MNNPKRPVRRPGARLRVAVLLLVVWLLLVGMGGAALLRSEQDGQRELRQLHALRAELAARFTETYVAELLAEEQLRARRALSGSVVTQGAFEQVVSSFEFEAAVLLDGRGRALRLHVAPAVTPGSIPTGPAPVP